MQNTNIRFDRTSNIDFYKTLQKRVRKHFKDTNTSKYGNASMVIKTIVMLSLYFVSFILILTVVDSVWLMFLMWFLMTLGMSGIGMSIMHDANHGSYSKNKFVNNFMGDLISVAGGNQISHEVIDKLIFKISL